MLKGKDDTFCMTAMITEKQAADQNRMIACQQC
jgi:hypothetical protein